MIHSDCCNLSSIGDKNAWAGPASVVTFLFLFILFIFFRPAFVCLSWEFLLWRLRVNSSDCPPPTKSRFESPLKFGPSSPQTISKPWFGHQVCLEKKKERLRKVCQNCQEMGGWGLLSMPNLCPPVFLNSQPVSIISSGTIRSRGANQYEHRAQCNGLESTLTRCLYYKV